MTPLEAAFLVLSVAVVAVWFWSLLKNERRERRRERELAEARAAAAAKLLANAPAPEGQPAPWVSKWPTTDDICANCRNWNYTEGQAVIESHPVFKEAAKFIPPQKMGAAVDEEGNSLPNEIPADCQWGDFGACNKHGELRWAAHTCADFERSEGRVALRVMTS